MNRAATLSLTPFSGLYRFLMNRRNGLYERGAFRSHRIDAPVISVGNLTMGGTGKTPLVLWMAEALVAQGLRVCVLTRGYRRKSRGRIVVSDGMTINATIDEAGDEAMMLAAALDRRAAVICDGDRLAGARWAIEKLQSNVILLDDGFQHRHIARDLDIVAIDATNPWGNGHLLPAGILREPATGLDRADCFVITRAHNPAQVGELRKRLSGINAAAPIYAATTRTAGIRPLRDEEPLRFETSGKAVAAFCAIGNPESFFSLLSSEGVQVVYQRAFRDHHRFDQSDIASVEAAARDSGAEALMTTAKDAVKLLDLDFNLPCYVFEIAIDINPVDEFRNLIFQTIQDFSKS